MNLSYLDLSARVVTFEKPLVPRGRYSSVKLALVPALALCCGISWAQQDAGQPIKVGETELTPALRLDYVSVDNTFRTPDEEVSSTGFILSPSVAWVAERRLLSVTAGYQGRYGTYSESVLDFNDHSLDLNVDADLHTRHRVFARFSVDREHEALGTGQGGLIQEVNDQIESTLVALQGGYTFGARNAKGNIGTGLIITSETFDNLGFLTEGDDNTVIRPFVLFSYRVSPDTRLVAEARYGLVDFQEDRRDRDELSFLTGVDLNATARTGGRVRIGVTQADYDTAGISDTTAFVADTDVYFRPRSYARFNLSFDRDLRTVDSDLNGTGESVVDELILTWGHQWSSRIATTARYEKERIDRECPNVDTVKDTVGIELGVTIRRWLSVGAGASRVHRMVDNCSDAPGEVNADYDVDTIGLFLRATL